MKGKGRLPRSSIEAARGGVAVLNSLFGLGPENLREFELRGRVRLLPILDFGLWLGGRTPRRACNRTLSTLRFSDCMGPPRGPAQGPEGTRGAAEMGAHLLRRVALNLAATPFFPSVLCRVSTYLPWQLLSRCGDHNLCCRIGCSRPSPWLGNAATNWAEWAQPDSQPKLPGHLCRRTG